MPPTIDPAVDAYLKKLPAAQRAALTNVRAQLRKALPDADEGMSYGLPAFKRGKSPIMGYGARPAYLSIYPMSGDVVGKHEKDLAKFEVTKGSIKFDAAKGFPTPLLKKLLKTRLAEMGAEGPAKRTPGKAAKKPAPKKAARPKPGNDVAALLDAKKHPLRKEIDALRKVVRAASPAIRERWKWNAPSFYADAKGDLDLAKVPMDRTLATVNLHKTDHVMLVLTFFHGIPAHAPGWLEGRWKDRRLATFRDAADIRARAKELQGLLAEMARRADRNATP